MYCRLLLIYTRCDYCNEWRREKRHECANMGKVKRLELWWQLYRTSLPVWDLENFRPMDFCWHECTKTLGFTILAPHVWYLNFAPLTFNCDVNIFILSRFLVFVGWPHELNCITNNSLFDYLSTGLRVSARARTHARTHARTQTATSIHDQFLAKVKDGGLDFPTESVLDTHRRSEVTEQSHLIEGAPDSGTLSSSSQKRRQVYDCVPECVYIAPATTSIINPCVLFCLN